MATDNDGLICAYRIDGSGRGTPLDWADLTREADPDSWIWIHFDRGHARPPEWAVRHGGLSPNIAEAVFATETRPRCSQTPHGTLLILRGVNLNPQADPEDMISVRVWIEGRRVITVRRRRLMAMDAIRQSYAEDTGPQSIGELVVTLTSGLVDRMSSVLMDFDDEVDALEELQDTGDISDLRSRLITARRKMIPLRRYLAPQRDALSQLIVAKNDWLYEWQRSRLREVADRVTRLVEELDAARERASVIHDSILNRQSERMNQIMLMLSIVAAIFLPLGFLTGLLGINVGGIPGAESSAAFWIVTAALALLGAGQLLLFRLLKWI